MPRFSGVSSTVTVWLIFLRPSPETQALWLANRPWRLFTSVTFSFCPLPLAMVLALYLCDFLAAFRRNTVRRMHRLQCVDSRAHHVDGIARAVTLGQHVAHTGALEYRAHGTAGDDAGTFRGRLHQHLRGAVAALHLVLQRVVLQVQGLQVLPGGLHRLLDGDGHFACLAVAETDLSGTVADHGQRRETELATALHDLGDPVHGHQLLEKIVATLFHSCHVSLPDVPPLARRVFKNPRTAARPRAPLPPGPSRGRGSETRSDRTPPTPHRRPSPSRRWRGPLRQPPPRCRCSSPSHAAPSAPWRRSPARSPRPAR